MNIDPISFVAQVTAAIRAPDGGTMDEATGIMSLTFAPPLTAAEQVTYNDLRTTARFGVTMTLAEWQAIKAQAAEARTFRQRSAATWNGLTTAQREADELQWLRDLTDVLAVIIRS